MPLLQTVCKVHFLSLKPQTRGFNKVLLFTGICHGELVEPMADTDTFQRIFN